MKKNNNINPKVLEKFWFQRIWCSWQRSLRFWTMIISVNYFLWKYEFSLFFPHHYDEYGENALSTYMDIKTEEELMHFLLIMR